MDNKSSNVAVKVESTIGNKETEQGRQSSDPTVKKNMREERSRKKDDKSVEQVLKALNSLETTEEKLAAMCKKYTDIVDENRKLQLTAKQTEKRFSMVQREKEQLQTEHSKAVLTRSRLESLCRELQRQNKAIKDESLLKIREEEEKRKEVSAKFQSTLNEITTLMQQNNEKNSKLREDNLEMTKKFKTVCEQYELREQQVEKITKQMQLEAQLSDAKLAKAKMEMAAEREALLKEKQQLLMDLTEYQSKCQELQTTEINLRSQINLYTDKYDEFQNALSRSNEVFGGFKGEMEKMSKKIIKLEKETSSWKQRWEKSHQALLEMAADKQQRDGELSLATRQLAQLQKLCRTLQAERTSLLAQLKTEGAAKIGDTVGRGDVPLESVQQSQEVATATSQCPANAESCRHELEKQTRAEETKNIDIVKQNEESSSSSEGILDMKPGLNEKSVAAEPKNSSVAENVSCVTEVQKEATNEQNSAQEPSLSCKSEPTPEFVVNPNESAINGISNIKHLGNADSQVSQPEKSSVMSISTTEEQKCVTENHIKSAKKKEESEVKSATAINEGELNKQEYSPESIINGQMPAALIINSTILPNDQEFPENKELPVADVNTACNTNHVSGNEVVEPAKVGGPETKKGKEGAKKRKNK